MNTRILIADDQALVRVGFRLILETESDFTVVAEAADGGAAVEATRATNPDIVLMDIRMPELNGIEATHRIMTDPQPPRVIILTTFDLDEYVYDALRAGASGFLLKDVSPEELIAAVRTVGRGESLLAPSVTRRLIEAFIRDRPGTETPEPRLETLTARERETLLLLGQGLSNAEIADEFVVSNTTVRTHVGHVLRKLDLRDRTQAVVLAYETGLVHPRRT